LLFQFFVQREPSDHFQLLKAFFIMLVTYSIDNNSYQFRFRYPLKTVFLHPREWLFC